MVLARALDHGALIARGEPCLVCGPEVLTYEQAVRMSWQLAHLLTELAHPDARPVAILSPNDPMAVLLEVACVRAGITFMVLNARGTVEDHVDAIGRSGASVLLYHDRLSSVAEGVRGGLSGFRLIPFGDAERGERPLRSLLEGRPTDAGDLVPAEPPVARLVTTGGTTGRQKLAGLTRASLEAGFASIMMSLDRLPRRPVHLVVAPISHAAGSLLFPTLAHGGTNVLVPLPDPARLGEQLAQSRAALTFMPPTLLYMLLAQGALRGRDLGHLRYLMLAGAPTAPAKLREAIELLGPVVGQFYAQTECIPFLTFMPPEELVDGDGQAREDMLTSCGRPTPLLEVSVMDEEGRILPPGSTGEVVVRGPQVFAGYVDDPTETEAARRFGWHHTGDVGKLDPEGFLRITDRKRDMIITGGFNVFPSEVEDVILAMPAVQECAVVGVSDPKWGEAVTAVIECKPGQVVSPAEVIAAVRERLGAIRAPKAVHVAERLPRSPVGKVLRRAVREMLRSS
ncbi:class I adenylate-forming enzyme family protein [Sphingomonas sp. CCH18-H6]|uniref:class I adenylate-forming enzyme family protein n=1 Tax=Sphingomonas sp. CCH18-H6 TaxID=1768787 RepID=UPI0008300AF0|nr:AMP-binding protein [Sphingomonas sp. CCH18-H6]